MNLKTIDLKTILNFEEMGKLFKNFSRTSGLDVALYDSDGIEQIALRSENSVCSALHGSEVCRKKIVDSGNKADELKTSYIYETSCGLVMCVVPFGMEGQTVGFITTGPVVLWEKDEYFYEETSRRCEKMGVDVPQAFFESVRRMDCENMTGVSEMLRVLVEYAVAAESKYLKQRLEISQMNLDRIKAQREMLIRESQPRYNRYPIELEKELIVYVQTGDKTGAKKIINKFLNDIFSYAGGDADIIKAKLYEFTAFLSRSAVEAGAPITSLTEIVKKSSGLLLENVDFMDMCSRTIEIMENFIDVVYAARMKKGISVHLASAIRFINEHYDENINLETLASNVFVSSYYLSHLFRSEMGTTFTDYLTKIRLENARTLLLEGASVEKAAYAVGYNDSNYFIKIFKRYVGITPAKYRNSTVKD